MTEKYRVGELKDSSEDKVVETWASALDHAETVASACDEQIFIGVWLNESGGLMAIYDGEDWYTK